MQLGVEVPARCRQTPVPSFVIGEVTNTRPQFATRPAHWTRGVRRIRADEAVRRHERSERITLHTV